MVYNKNIKPTYLGIKNYIETVTCKLSSAGVLLLVHAPDPTPGNGYINQPGYGESQSQSQVVTDQDEVSSQACHSGASVCHCVLPPGS